jgi:hypothetical protein
MKDGTRQVHDLTSADVMTHTELVKFIQGEIPEAEVILVRVK